MPDIKNYIKDEYNFELVRVHYEQDAEINENGEYSLRIYDEVKTEIQQRDLCVFFTRQISFEPKELFEIGVQFKVVLHFADGVSQEELQEIDWENEIKRTNTPFLTNVISRASGILSSITSASGQAPLITPPTIVQ